MKHKICYCAGRAECHHCGLPYYGSEENEKEWIEEVEKEECSVEEEREEV